MRAILEAPRRLAVRDTDEPRPMSQDILVAVELAGVCGSDVSLFKGSRPATYPLILGHEAIGRVVEPGQSGLTRGARVVVEPNIPCGGCAVCQNGQGNICPHKRSLGLNARGLFADRALVPTGFAHAVPVEIGPRDAVGLEPLAVAVHAFRLGQAGESDAVAVIGCGNEGLLVTQVAVAKGARVMAADIREDRLAVAESVGAATRALLVKQGESPHELGARIAADWGPVVVFECAGAAPALELSLNAVAIGRRVVVVGLTPQPVPLVPLRFVRRGLSLVSSLIYDHPTDFGQLIDLVRSGRVHPGALVTSVQMLDDAPAAFQRAADGHAGKALLDIGGIF
jgi:threonine dehydrogenase-like Zn-dependent dehydrogenase